MGKLVKIYNIQYNAKRKEQIGDHLPTRVKAISIKEATEKVENFLREEGLKSELTGVFFSCLSEIQ